MALQDNWKMMVCAHVCVCVCGEGGGTDNLIF